MAIDVNDFFLIDLEDPDNPSERIQKKIKASTLLNGMSTTYADMRLLANTDTFSSGYIKSRNIPNIPDNYWMVINRGTQPFRVSGSQIKAFFQTGPDDPTISGMITDSHSPGTPTGSIELSEIQSIEEVTINYTYTTKLLNSGGWAETVGQTPEELAAYMTTFANGSNIWDKGTNGTETSPQAVGTPPQGGNSWTPTSNMLYQFNEPVIASFTRFQPDSNSNLTWMLMGSEDGITWEVAAQYTGYIPGPYPDETNRVWAYKPFKYYMFSYGWEQGGSNTQTYYVDSSWVTSPVTYTDLTLANNNNFNDITVGDLIQERSNLVTGTIFSNYGGTNTYQPGSSSYDRTRLWDGIVGQNNSTIGENNSQNYWSWDFPDGLPFTTLKIAGGNYSSRVGGLKINGQTITNVSDLPTWTNLGTFYPESLNPLGDKLYRIDLQGWSYGPALSAIYLDDVMVVDGQYSYMRENTIVVEEIFPDDNKIRVNSGGSWSAADGTTTGDEPRESSVTATISALTVSRLPTPNFFDGQPIKMVDVDGEPATYVPVTSAIASVSDGAQTDMTTSSAWTNVGYAGWDIAESAANPGTGFTSGSATYGYSYFPGVSSVRITFDPPIPGTMIRYFRGGGHQPGSGYTVTINPNAQSPDVFSGATAGSYGGLPLTLDHNQATISEILIIAAGSQNTAIVNFYDIDQKAVTNFLLSTPAILTFTDPCPDLKFFQPDDVVDENGSTVVSRDPETLTMVVDGGTWSDGDTVIGPSKLGQATVKGDPTSTTFSLDNSNGQWIDNTNRLGQSFYVANNEGLKETWSNFFGTQLQSWSGSTQGSGEATQGAAGFNGDLTTVYETNSCRAFAQSGYGSGWIPEATIPCTTATVHIFTDYKTNRQGFWKINDVEKTVQATQENQIDIFNVNVASDGGLKNLYWTNSTSSGAPGDPREGTGMVGVQVDGNTLIDDVPLPPTLRTEYYRRVNIKNLAIRQALRAGYIKDRALELGWIAHDKAVDDWCLSEGHIDADEHNSRRTKLQTEEERIIQLHNLRLGLLTSEYETY